MLPAIHSRTAYWQIRPVFGCPHLAQSVGYQKRDLPLKHARGQISCQTFFPNYTWNFSTSVTERKRFSDFKNSDLIAKRMRSQLVINPLHVVVPRIDRFSIKIYKVHLVQKGDRLLLEVKRHLVPTQSASVVFLRHGLAHHSLGQSVFID